MRTLDTKRIYLEANDRDGVVLSVGRFERAGARGEVVHFCVEGPSPVLRVADSARKPIGGVRVGVVGVDLDATWARSCYTDGDGLCVPEGVAFSSVGLSLRHPDHDLTAIQVVDLPRNGAKPVELVLDARLAMRLRVLDHAIPLPGIELLARDLGRYEDGLGDATSDGAGVAVWRQVGAGTYEVSVVHHGVWPDVARVDVKEASEPIPFQVRRLGNVTFRVSTTLGNPVAGARFELDCVERGASVAQWIADGSVPAPPKGLVTDEFGVLTVRGLPNGEFRYRAALPNGAALEGTVLVPPSSTLELPLRVECPPALRGSRSVERPLGRVSRRSGHHRADAPGSTPPASPPSSPAPRAELPMERVRTPAHARGAPATRGPEVPMFKSIGIGSVIAAFVLVGCAGTGQRTHQSVDPVVPAQEPAFTPEVFKAHHAEIREHLGHIDAMAQRLSVEAPGQQRDTMRFVVSFFEEHILTHAADEERTLYPRADAKVGASFTRSMRYEHTVVGAWVKELRDLSQRPEPDAQAFVRRTQRLLGLLEAHFGAEEEVVVPALATP